jgi:hypothetical protein
MSLAVQLSISGPGAHAHNKKMRLLVMQMCGYSALHASVKSAEEAGATQCQLIDVQDSYQVKNVKEQLEKDAVNGFMRFVKAAAYMYEDFDPAQDKRLDAEELAAELKARAARVDTGELEDGRLFNLHTVLDDYLKGKKPFEMEDRAEVVAICNAVCGTLKPRTTLRTLSGTNTGHP